MEEKELWDEVKSMFQDSDRKICIYEGEESAGHSELEGLGLSSLSVLGVMVSYTSGICIDNWIRMIGQSCRERRGIADYNELGTGEKFLLWRGCWWLHRTLLEGFLPSTGSGLQRESARYGILRRIRWIGNAWI